MLFPRPSQSALCFAIFFSTILTTLPSYPYILTVALGAKSAMGMLGKAETKQFAKEGNRSDPVKLPEENNTKDANERAKQRPYDTADDVFILLLFLLRRYCYILS